MAKFILISFFSLMLLGCYVNPDNIQTPTLDHPENILTWQVQQPIEKVFKTYWDYTETNLAGGDFLWSGGRRVKAQFYGPDAEIRLTHEGNIFIINKTYITLELQKVDESLTAIKYQYEGKLYKQYAKAYQDLF